MTDIVKKVNPSIPTNERSQRFDHNDAGTGDVLMFKESLGKPATRIIVEATDEMFIRMNVYHTSFPMRTLLEDDFNQFNLGVLNLTSGIRYKDDTNALILLDAGETFELNNDMPVDDMELVTTSGIFEVIVM